MSHKIRWYGFNRWRIRARMQMREHPLCAMCLQQGIVKAAEVADHIIPHKGDYDLFWFGRLQSLCSEHHKSAKYHIESKGFRTDIGADGYPIDPNHPFNRT